MKGKVYLRIAKSKSGYRYAIDRKKNNKPLNNGYYRKTYFPTITIALNLDINDKLFEQAQAEIDLKIADAMINSEIKIEQDKQ